MTEEEFIALLAIEGKTLIIDKIKSRGNSKNLYKPVPYYSVAVGDTQNYTTTPFTNAYRSRAYAIQKMIQKYYADN